jgi:uncharacterized protein YjiK
VTGSGSSYIYTPDLNFNGEDKLQFSVTDNRGGISQPVNIDIVITPVNDVPVIALNDTYTISENISATGIILNQYASDPENDDISVSLGETGDSKLFAIDASSQELVFAVAPDFENPLDANTDNTYHVSLVYTDSQGGQAIKMVDIKVIDESIIQLAMIYPTPNANLGGNATQVKVRGTLTDIEDNELLPADVSAVTINGQQASLTDDRSAWSFELALSEAATTLDFEMHSRETVTTQSQILYNTKLPAHIEFPYDGIFDSANNRLLLLDSAGFDALKALDLSTNTLSILSDEKHGTGPNFVDVRGLAFDPENNRVFVGDRELAAIFVVDLNTGNRTILTDNNTEPGFYLSWYATLDYDVINHQLYTISDSALIKIDVATGNMSITADEITGEGERIDDYSLLTVDPAANKAFISNIFNPSRYLSIDLTTGDRTTIADSTVGDGPKLNRTTDMVLNSDRTALLVFGESSDGSKLIQVDITTGERSIISDKNTNTGAVFEFVQGIIADNTGERLWLSDFGAEQIIAVDLDSGNSQALPEPNPELPLRDPSGLLMDSANKRLLVVDNDTLYSVDVSTTQTSGQLVILSDKTKGAGPNLKNVYRLVWDEQHNRVFAISGGDSERTLIAIDLTTGDRSVLAEFKQHINSYPSDMAFDNVNNRIVYIELAQNQGLHAIDLLTGTFSEMFDYSDFQDYGWIFPDTLALDTVSNHAYLTSSYQQAVFLLNFTTGNFSTLSGKTSSGEIFGTGPLFSSPTDVEVDKPNNRLIIVDRTLNSVFSVDLTSGDRTIVSEDDYYTSIKNGGKPVYDSQNNRLFVSDFATRSIYVIDLETGQRANVVH